LPGKAEKVDRPEKAEAQAEPVRAETPEPAVKPKPAPQSWKKDHWGAWEKLSTDNPQLADYILQRESEFQRGVSAYKADYDRSRPLVEAIAPYHPFLQQIGMPPERFITALAQADQVLRFGTPQQKLQAFAKFAQDYQIPIHEMLVQGEDGKVYVNQQYTQPQQSQQPQLGPEDIRREVQGTIQDLYLRQQVQEFLSAKDDKGNPKYPHIERVRQDMDGILRAELAQDLPTAYEKAIRMHDDIWQAEQAAKQAAAQKAQQEAQARQVAKAKATATSVRSATPSGESAAKPKGIRASLEAAVEARSGGGRV